MDNHDKIGGPAPATGVPVIRREKEREERPAAQQDDDTTDNADPVDAVDLPAEGISGFADPDAPDAYYILLSAVQELVAQHRAHYTPGDFITLTDRLAFLHSHAVTRLYWPPSLTLPEALDAACIPFQDGNS